MSFQDSGYSAQELARFVSANLTTYFGDLSEKQQEGSFRSPGIRGWYSDIPHHWFSGVVCSRLPANNEKVVVEAVRNHFRGRTPAGFSWWLAADLELDSWGEHLEAQGFSLKAGPPGMAIHLQALSASRPGLAELDLRIVDTLELLTLWTEILIEGFEMPQSTFRSFYNINEIMGINLPVRHFIGFVDGQPAAISTLYEGAGVAGIYNVATLPAFRRQGLGAALTWHGLNDARQRGLKIGILQSSDMGFGVYQKLGFEKVSNTPHYFHPPEN